MSAVCCRGPPLSGLVSERFMPLGIQGGNALSWKHMHFGSLRCQCERLPPSE